MLEGQMKVRRKAAAPSNKLDQRRLAIHWFERTDPKAAVGSLTIKRFRKCQ
tara:strand:- start:474 stop:626 length:153 start_codon:yes stop_codon:yes gene_type:complete